MLTEYAVNQIKVLRDDVISGKVTYDWFDVKSCAIGLIIKYLINDVKTIEEYFQSIRFSAWCQLSYRDITGSDFYESVYKKLNNLGFKYDYFSLIETSIEDVDCVEEYISLLTGIINTKGEYLEKEEILI